MSIDVMARTNRRPLVASLTARQWRACLRADFGIRLLPDTPQEDLYVAWCEAYQARALPHWKAPRQPQAVSPRGAAA